MNKTELKKKLNQINLAELTKLNPELAKVVQDTINYANSKESGKIDYESSELYETFFEDLQRKHPQVFTGGKGTTNKSSSNKKVTEPTEFKKGDKVKVSIGNDLYYKGTVQDLPSDKKDSVKISGIGDLVQLNQVSPLKEGELYEVGDGIFSTEKPKNKETKLTIWDNARKTPKVGDILKAPYVPTGIGVVVDKKGKYITVGTWFKENSEAPKFHFHTFFNDKDLKPISLKEVGDHIYKTYSGVFDAYKEFKKEKSFKYLDILQGTPEYSKNDKIAYDGNTPIYIVSKVLDSGNYYVNGALIIGDINNPKEINHLGSYTMQRENVIPFSNPKVTRMLVERFKSMLKITSPGDNNKFYKDFIKRYVGGVGDYFGKAYRVFIVHKDESPVTEFLNLTKEEADKKYEEFIKHPNSEIVTLDFPKFNEYRKIEAWETVKMKTLKETHKQAGKRLLKEARTLRRKAKEGNLTKEERAKFKANIKARKQWRKGFYERGGEIKKTYKDFIKDKEDGYRVSFGFNPSKVFIKEKLVPVELYDTDFTTILADLYSNYDFYNDKEDALKEFVLNVNELFYIKWGLDSDFSSGFAKQTTWGKDGRWKGMSKEEAKDFVDSLYEIKNINEIKYSVNDPKNYAIGGKTTQTNSEYMKKRAEYMDIERKHAQKQAEYMDMDNLPSDNPKKVALAKEIDELENKMYYFEGYAKGGMIRKDIIKRMKNCKANDSFSFNINNIDYIFEHKTNPTYFTLTDFSIDDEGDNIPSFYGSPHIADVINEFKYSVSKFTKGGKFVPKLNIVELNTKGKNKFAIVSGKTILKKFKTFDAAKDDLNEKKDFYEYWAGSTSVSYENSDFKEILLEEGGEINRVWSDEEEKAVKELDERFKKELGKKEIDPYSYEASILWKTGGYKDEMKKIFKN